MAAWCVEGRCVVALLLSRLAVDGPTRRTSMDETHGISEHAGFL